MFPYNILFITEYKLTFLVINIEKAVTQSQIKKKNDINMHLLSSQLFYRLSYKMIGKGRKST